MHDVDEFEDGLIGRFKRHLVLADVARLADDDFAAVLLQRRFLSLAFTPVYDLAIDLLEDEVGLRMARVILREEYPDDSGHTRSHREDMAEDLIQLGIPRKEIVESRPTAETTAAITGTLGLVADAGRQGNADLRLLAFLRFWGEVLVSVEYELLWPRMAPILIRNGKNRSRFYHPHYVHDAKAHPLATGSLLSGTHSDRLGLRVSELLAREESPDAFKEVEEGALRLKEAFYDQFRPMLSASGS
ncbi:hypothetical protein [Actinomadura rudentiformis]|uniref:Iron-containing redox enzyme family protein n=1 Tax=Actinomadura rudentiformis TaxID=359158 RepID=A0A6H9YVP0_9ACTN|nr:hypothetical protein [Actinomadura rudentiformis]KAB2346353.1 hypothetical protein F8566_23035 [Actinomadura rudentiformis]